MYMEVGEQKGVYPLPAFVPVFPLFLYLSSPT